MANSPQSCHFERVGPERFHGCDAFTHPLWQATKSGAGMNLFDQSALQRDAS